MKKLVSILLTLTLCVALVIPAFASPGEEPPAPEETETVPVEEDADLIVPHIEETGALSTHTYSYHCDFSELDWQGVEDEEGVLKRAYVVLALPKDPSGTEMQFIGSWDCGHDRWGTATEQDPFEWEEDGETDTLIAHYLVAYACKTAGCGGLRYDMMWKIETLSDG